ncbi:MAG: VOC family protein [Dehalococcoidia bacterium]|nr:VOC family protein [Dehalococcoidia bacterium]
MTYSQLRHVGFLVDDVRKTADFYVSAFGIGPFRTWEVGFFDVRVRGGAPQSFTTRISLARMGEAELELVESHPMAGNAAFFDEVKRETVGCMHHLAFTVPNLEEAVAGFKQAGIDVLMAGQFTGGRFAYLDSEAKTGILYELMEMTPRQPKAGR